MRAVCRLNRSTQGVREELARRPRLRDPGAAYRRSVQAALRVGDRQCACGEMRPKALIPGSDPTICAKCDRKKNGKATEDEHHVAGKANDPTTIPVDVNDHRAELSPAQDDWPTETLENRKGNPLLACAARDRGLVDTNGYFLNRNAEMMECLNAYLVKKLGPDWWKNTPVEQYEPKR